MCPLKSIKALKDKAEEAGILVLINSHACCSFFFFFFSYRKTISCFIFIVVSYIVSLIDQDVNLCELLEHFGAYLTGK